MMENERFDIFIAYYGNSENGSERSARELYDYIKQREIYPGKPIRAYFHPVVNPYGRFEDTPLIVARTPMFLLVVDKNIKRTVDGQMIQYRNDGTLSNVFEEVRTFYDSPMHKSYGGDSAAKLFITDGFSCKDGEKLHPLFSGRTALCTKEAVCEWITYFYRNTYISRLYAHYKYLASNCKEDFLNGDWVREAEEIWEYVFDEGIGRTLMIYYIMKADSGSEIAIRKLKHMYDRFSGVDVLEPSTNDILRRIRSKYIF